MGVRAHNVLTLLRHIVFKKVLKDALFTDNPLACNNIRINNVTNLFG